jgi:hypothetical protein
MSIESPRNQQDFQHRHFEKRLLGRLGLSENGDSLPLNFDDIDPLDGILLSSKEKYAWLSEQEAAQRRFGGVRWVARLIDWFRAEPSSLAAGRTKLNITEYEEEHPTPLTSGQAHDIAQIAGLYKDFKPRQDDFYEGILYDTEPPSSEEDVTAVAGI